MVSRVGLEPTTRRLRVCCSTIELAAPLEGKYIADEARRWQDPAMRRSRRDAGRGDRRPQPPWTNRTISTVSPATTWVPARRERAHDLAVDFDGDRQRIAADRLDELAPAVIARGNPVRAAVQPDLDARGRIAAVQRQRHRSPARSQQLLDLGAAEIGGAGDDQRRRAAGEAGTSRRISTAPTSSVSRDHERPRVGDGRQHLHRHLHAGERQAALRRVGAQREVVDLPGWISSCPSMASTSCSCSASVDR